MEKDNSTVVLTEFIKKLKIPVTATSISDELQKHPDYGSILAFSDVLDNFNIPNSAYTVPHEDLSEVPTPFIAFLTDKTYAVISRMDDQQVIISTDKWRNKTLTKNDFLRRYGRSVLLIENTEHAKESDYRQKQKAEVAQNLLMPSALTLLALILLVAIALHPGYLTSFGIQTGLLVLLKALGLTVGVLLLIQSIDANNPLIQKLCGGDGDKNCNAILSSTAAKIGPLSWSEVGFFYFAGTMLALLFNNNKGTLQLLALINLTTLPYTIYSIYYQWQMAKQWCIFCCVVQAVLWLEFFSFLPSFSGGINMPTATGVIDLLLALLLPIALWLLAKPYLLQLTKVHPLTQQLRRFKYNKDLFHAILKDQPKYAMPAEEWSITLGNVEANNIITMVSNPYCQPCTKAHMRIEEALNNLDDVQVRIVFTGKNTDEQNKDSRIHRHLMALNGLADKTIVKHALHDWYAQNQKDYDSWAKNYPVELNGSNNHKLDRQKAWVDMADITATPTLLLNGYRLPAIYQLHDLKYMLD